MIDNFVDARKSRRKIIELLKKQQIEDSCCADKITQLGLDAKRRLLESLATWLASFEPGREPNEEDRNALSQAQLSLNDWFAFQRKEAQLKENLSAAKIREDEAYKLYDSVARFGSLQISFMNDADKAKAKKFQEDHRTAKATREQIEKRLNDAREGIRAMIASFLSNAINRDSLEILATRSSVRRELSTMLEGFEDRGRAVWDQHAKQQGSSLEELRRECERLSGFYAKEGISRQRLE